LTPLQGQYLAYIVAYTKLHRQAPAEADLQRYFRVTAPSVHDMILRLHREGLISREPSVPRSIRVLVAEDQLPPLR
jgi:repressor LexA